MNKKTSKFKIGDKVKYVRKYSPFIVYNTIGIIVRQKNCGWDVLFSNGVWFCVEGNLIKTLPIKNQQLLFSFMSEVI